MRILLSQKRKSRIIDVVGRVALSAEEMARISGHLDDFANLSAQNI